MEAWGNAGFVRRSLVLERGEPAGYELIKGCHAQPQSVLAHWRLPVTVSSVAVGFAVFKDMVYEPCRGGVVLDTWNGRGWQRLRGRPAKDDSALADEAWYRRFGVRFWVWNFPEVTTQKLRLNFLLRPAAGAKGRSVAIRRLECLDHARLPAGPNPPPAHPRFVPQRQQQRLSAAQIHRIDRSGRDLLGTQILRQCGEPDYASVAQWLYPLDFHKSALGRINDGSKTIVTWNGTLIQTEGITAAAWNHYTGEAMAAGWIAGDAHSRPVPLVMAGMEKLVDRWFAFAMGPEPNPELVGTYPGRTRQAWSNGWQPVLCTSYRLGGKAKGITGKFTAAVSAATTTPYLNIVEVEVANRGTVAVDTAVTVIMGRHPSEAMHETAHFASSGSCPGRDPLFFAPQPTNYQLNAAGRTLFNSAGEIVLHSSMPGQLGGTALEQTFRVPLRLKPGETQTFHLSLPGVTAPQRQSGILPPPAREQAACRSFWTQALTAHTCISTPEARVNNCQRQGLAQILTGLLNHGKLKYGSYWYEEYYGVEEAEAVTTLAKYGYAAEAQAAVDIMLSEDALDTNNYHHQYRHGVAAQTTAEVYALSGDRDWLERAAPRLEAAGEWIVSAITAETGRFAGLLPKRTYGGDISTPARNLSTNARCWRGLRDAGLLLRELGKTRQAARFLEHAAAYREQLLALISLLVDRRGSLPFLPMGFDIGVEGTRNYRAVEKKYPSLSRESMGTYWHIFAVWLLRSGILDPQSAEARWITDYIENRGGLLLGLLRVGKRHRDASVGIDAHYGLGYIQTLLARGEREKFLLSFYGLLAHGMSRNSFSAPESCAIFPLRADPATWNAIFQETMWEWGANRNHYLTEPLSSGATAVVLSLLRDMLVREDCDCLEANPSLHLLSGVPGAWLLSGRQLTVQAAPTRFGPVSLQAQCRQRGKLELQISGEWRRAPDANASAACSVTARLCRGRSLVPYICSQPLVTAAWR